MQSQQQQHKKKTAQQETSFQRIINNNFLAQNFWFNFCKKTFGPFLLSYFAV